MIQEPLHRHASQIKILYDTSPHRKSLVNMLYYGNNKEASGNNIEIIKTQKPLDILTILNDKLYLALKR